MAAKTSILGWVAVVAGLAGLAAAIGLAVVQPWNDAAEPAAAPTPTAEPEPVAVLSAATDAPAPTADGVRAAIDDLVRDSDLGGSVSAAVVDVSTGDLLYGRDPDAPTVSASTIKLVTGATVLASYGPAHRLDTVAVAGAEPGEVVLVGGGDPTLAIDEDGFYPGAARLDALAEQVQEALGDTPVERVTVDATRFTGPVEGPWEDDITAGYVGPVTALMTDGARTDPGAAGSPRPSARFSDPDLAAGRAFAGLLGADPDQVQRGEAPAAVSEGPPATPAVAGEPSPTPAASAAGTELGRVSSPPLQRLVELLIRTSDNIVAEVLARHVALAHDQPASFEGAGAAMAAGLEELGIDPAGSTLADGSGLARQDRLTATQLTDLLVSAAAEPAQPHAGIFAALPVGGWSGTLVDRYVPPQSGTEPGAGHVRAKTGSLDQVTTLAGLVQTADGRVLGFALLADDVPADQVTAREQLDQITATLAGCGCR